MSASLTVSPGAVVCNESKLLGEVSIGARTVVHPKATIIAEAGPIIIGENNLIEEQAVIVNARNPDSQVVLTDGLWLRKPVDRDDYKRYNYSTGLGNKHDHFHVLNYRPMMASYPS